MEATLYTIPPSHPGHAARAMLAHKGIRAKIVNLIPGSHAIVIRALGFEQATVPALRVDGRKVQTSLGISRALDELVPERPLFPADAKDRAAVEEAERWGESDLQDVPRFVTRWLAMDRPEMRTHMASEAGLPAAELLGALNAPVAALFASRVGADDPERVRVTLATLPEKLDRVDALISDGVIGGSEPNAADFQIAATLRALLSFEDLAPMMEGRPATALATRLFPSWPTTVPAGMVPPAWLGPLRA